MKCASAALTTDIGQARRGIPSQEQVTWNDIFCVFYAMRTAVDPFNALVTQPYAVRNPYSNTITMHARSRTAGSRSKAGLALKRCEMHEEDDAEMRAIWERVVSYYGFVPRIYQELRHNPEALKTFFYKNE